MYRLTNQKVYKWIMDAQRILRNAYKSTYIINECIPKQLHGVPVNTFNTQIITIRNVYI